MRGVCGVCVVLSIVLGGACAKVTSVRSTVHRAHVQRSIRERSICSIAILPVMTAPVPVLLEAGQHKWHEELLGLAAHMLHRHDNLVSRDMNEVVAEVGALVDATIESSQHTLALAHALATAGDNYLGLIYSGAHAP